ncbi:hypothetical protein HA402_000834 [Bradysia odoriphaga]|nr:hypothetical protein HA402_000834 [Bradysia odoriphaga]
MVDYIETNSSISSSGSISLFFNVKRSVPNFYSKVLLTVDSSNGVYDLELINRTIDTCEFYRNPKYEPILQVFYKLLTKDGIFPKRCPIMKNLYFLKDVVIDPESFPPIMPYKGIIGDITMMAKEGNGFKITSAFKIHAKFN